MLNGVFKLLVAAAIAFGILTYVTGGDYAQIPRAADQAMGQAMARKQERQAAKASAAEPAGEEKAVAIEVVTKLSRAESLSSSLKMTGATEASRRVDVRAETSGIVAVAPRKGARVRRGDLLCRQQLGARSARREASVARLQQALIEARAQQKLSERGLAAANATSAKRVDAEVLRSDIMQIDVEIGQLEIRAPFDGVVEGESAELGSLLQPGGVCATIVDPDPLKVSGFVPEFQIGKLRLGDPASAVLVTGESVRGTITYIAQTADAATRTFEVEIDVPNPDYRLRDAVTARIEIPLDAKPAHRLPQSALTLNDEGQIGVMVAAGDRAAFRAVEILRDNEDGVWVSGLGNEATVIVVGQEYVSEGSRLDATPQTGSILGTQS